MKVDSCGRPKRGADGPAFRDVDRPRDIAIVGGGGEVCDRVIGAVGLHAGPMMS